MTLQAYPVKLEHGTVQAIDGSALPEKARAVLVILPEPVSLAEWQKPFEEFFAEVEAHPAQRDLETLSDEELNCRWRRSPNCATFWRDRKCKNTSMPQLAISSSACSNNAPLSCSPI